MGTWYDDNFANVANKYLPTDECEFYAPLVSMTRLFHFTWNAIITEYDYNARGQWKRGTKKEGGGEEKREEDKNRTLSSFDRPLWSR